MSRQVPPEQALFDILVYLVNSAPTSLGETPSLAAFRMLDAAHRLAEVLQQQTTDLAQQQFLAEVRADYQAHHHLVMTDQTAFQQWMPDFVRLCTEEAMRRAVLPASEGIPTPAPTPVHDPTQKGLGHDDS